MRVHRLEIEAIGPFAERVTIDVDALSAEGLFLIHGPTGSGKTSLLDAICFALYADVPGARSKRGLRSDHAAQDAVPRVTLELTAGLRRLRLTRSPEFSRPKKRGTGLLSVQAQVSLEEHLDGRWVGLSTRHDEVADVVKDVLGMGMSQFAKVVLLPQGEFAAFLRSTPDDRREVLERLFDISAFSDVEAWLAQARRDAGGDLERARGRLTSGLARVEDVLADLADPLAGPPVEALPCDPSVGALLTEIMVTLDHRVSTTMAAFDAASIAERAAAESLAEGKTVDVLRTRGARALSQLEVLAASEPEHQQRAHVLAEAERAASLAGHVAALDRAEADAATARAAAEHSRQSLAPSPLAWASDHEVDDALGRLHDLDATVAELVRHTQEAAARSQRRDSLAARLRRLATARRVAAELVAASEAERDDLTEQGRLRAAGAGRIAELELLVTGAHDRITLLDAADLDLSRAAGLAPRRTTLREAVVDARTELLDLRQRRLDDMSAELALALTEGAPCPVCGGVEHPHPASAIDPVSAEQLVAAEHRVDEVTTQLRDVEVEIETLTASAATRLATLGGASRESLEAEATARSDELSAARDDAQAHAVIASRLVELAAELEDQRARLTSTIAQDETATALLGELDAQHEAAALRVADLWAAHASCPCGTEDATDHGRLAHLLGEHRSALEALAGATLRAEASARALDEALAGAGFSGREQARAALRSPGEVALLRAQVTAHEEDGAAARAVLADPEVSSALAADPVDLQALQAAEVAARAAMLAAQAVRDDAARGLRLLERLVPDVEAACAAVAAAEAHDTRVRDLADTTSGTGPDNTLRMRLTAYVLAARLEKVAGLANERLAVMGGGRFVLEHSDERAARGARSGLGLRVLDQWTGRVRDTATLSGGESFMASLALALGLADAVREESGGFDLGTLFIDEGFGSLDDDSLEQVLTVLDGLREGGRAVGVVSHVADLRTRITHQAVVHKGASGSTVEVRAGARSDQPAA
jgi:exonuclease SbcC